MNETKYSDVMRLVEKEKIRKALPYLIYGKEKSEKRIQKIGECGWNPETMKKGMERLLEIAEEPYIYPIYESGDCENDVQKIEVNLIHFPAAINKGEKPYVIICAGGGYEDVCSIAEAYPAAAELNQLGYAAFALTYRVGGDGLLPKPIDDLAAAIRFIRNKSEMFRINPERYLVIGFSAAGHLAALWGTDNHGYRMYDLPKPEAIFAVYPLINSELFGNADFIPHFRNILYGKNYKENQIKEYNVDEHMSQDYPASYIVCCKDDNLVPYENSVRLKERLDGLKVPAELELAEKGGHGFGDGRGTDAEGWIYRAVDFYEKINRK